MINFNVLLLCFPYLFKEISPSKVRWLMFPVKVYFFAFYIKFAFFFHILNQHFAGIIKILRISVSKYNIKIIFPFFGRVFAKLVFSWVNGWKNWPVKPFGLRYYVFVCVCESLNSGLSFVNEYHTLKIFSSFLDRFYKLYFLRIFSFTQIVKFIDLRVLIN